MAKYVIQLDTDYPKKAHARIEEICMEESSKWTETEIRNAQEITKSLLWELHMQKYSPVFYYADEGLIVDLGFGCPSRDARIEIGNDIFDVYNKDIAVCYALCRLTRTLVPGFILKHLK